jgi:hypothetical protein
VPPEGDLLHGHQYNSIKSVLTTNVLRSGELTTKKKFLKYFQRWVHRLLMSLGMETLLGTEHALCFCISNRLYRVKQNVESDLNSFRKQKLLKFQTVFNKDIPIVQAT